MRYEDLLKLCDTYAAWRGVTHWRVSVLVGCGGGFFARLRSGKGCTVRTAQRVVEWFSENWPDDLPWPEGVPRPEVKREEAA